MSEERKKILCIEDDHETAGLIAEELVDRGYEVCVARDGREGLAAILKHDPDLVLSDISMPGMSGFELLERITALAPRFRHMPFVFLTALTDRNNELKGRQLGADDYVTKPIDFEMLETIIHARLAGVSRNEKWPKLIDLNDREVETLDLGRSWQDFGGNRQNPRPHETDRGFSYRQCADQARCGQSHPGGHQGRERKPDRAVTRYALPRVTTPR